MIPKNKNKRQYGVVNLLIGVLIITLVSGLFSFGYSQCSKQLSEAEQKYNSGRFDEVIESITKCLEDPTITENEKKQAYRLLGLTYIAQDYLEEAKAAVKRLLNLIPNYKADTVQDPPSFANLVEEVRSEMESKEQPAPTPPPVSKPKMGSKQTSGSKSTRFGFRGGLNMANISEDIFSGTILFDIDGFPVAIELDQGMWTTFGFGGFVEYPISPMFALQFNAIYNMKGVKTTGDIDANIGGINITGSIENITKLTYLSFPILGKLGFGQNGSAQPYLIFGPEVGILLSAKNVTKVEAEAMGQSASDEEEVDLKDGTESLEIAINFGAGITIPMGNISLFVDGMYSLGLTNIIKDSDQSVKNNVIYINLGLIFGGN
jgi:hypothetical protein